MIINCLILDIYAKASLIPADVAVCRAVDYTGSVVSRKQGVRSGDTGCLCHRKHTSTRNKLLSGILSCSNMVEGFHNSKAPHPTAPSLACPRSDYPGAAPWITFWRWVWGLEFAHQAARKRVQAQLSHLQRQILVASVVQSLSGL